MSQYDYIDHNLVAKPRLFGLDAVRALAILSVLLYHLEIPGLFNAGFLGVDIFFNLSGFLITSLLLREYSKFGRINILNFYLRRIRRLFPAVFFLVIGCILLAPEFLPGAYDRFCQDIPAAFLYFSNWWQIYSKQSYFENFGNPPLLQHLWSLAVEEQYYIVWPLAFLGLVRIVSVSTVGVICFGLAGISAAWMAYIYEYWVAGADPSRAYLGSDSHAMGLFLGSALACYWSPWSEDRRENIGWVKTWQPWIISIAFAMIIFLFVHWNEGTPAIFLGGIFLVGVLTVFLIVGLTHIEVNESNCRHFAHLIVSFVRWIGIRSYSIYLWHWPIFIACGVGGELSARVIGACLILTAVAAELSYRLVELPFQRVNFKNLFAGYPLSMAAISIVSLIAVMIIIEPPIRLGFQVVNSQPKAIDAFADARVEVTHDSSVTTVNTENKSNLIQRKNNLYAPSLSDYSMLNDEKILVIGDSVMLGAREHLMKNFAEIKVDAIVGRQASQGLLAVKNLTNIGEKFNIAVIHLGTNGYINESQFIQLLTELSNYKLVEVFNVYANRRWTEPNNEIIERVSRKFANVRVVDWYSMGKNNPQFFVSDGVHLTSLGIVAVTSVISRDTGIPLLGSQLSSKRKLSLLPQTHPQKANAVLKPLERESTEVDLSNTDNSISSESATLDERSKESDLLDAN